MDSSSDVARRRPPLVVCALVITALSVIPSGVGAAAARDANPAAVVAARKVCKLLKPAKIEKVLGAPAKRSDVEGTEVAGAKTCAWDVGPGLGEPGAALVVVSYFSGPIVVGIRDDIESRAEPLSGRAVWDPLIDVAYVVKKKAIVGVNVSYTNSDPSSEDLKPKVEQLAKAAARRA